METSVCAPDVVLASNPVTNLLGVSANWTDTTTHIRYLTAGDWPVQAEAELGLDASPSGFVDDFYPYKYPNAPHYKRGTLSLASCRDQLAECNRISLRVFPDMRDRAALWLEAVGAPVWTAATFPLRPGQWNEIFLDLGHLKPEERQRIQSLCLGGTPLGRLPGDPPWFRYYLKDLRLEQVLPRRIQGWEVSERYVSLSQAGFAPWHTGKQAVFSGRLKAARFRVRAAADNRIAHSGLLTVSSNAFGVFKLADFSALTAVGDYFVEAGDTRSVTFPITDAPFREAADKCTQFLACMRSGTKTPAHPACFQDDALREDTRTPVDLAGGWFDASDLRLYISMSMSSILRPLAIATGCATPDRGLARALDREMLWGARFLDKIWDAETGLPFTMLCVHAPRTEKYKAIPYFKNNNYWTDNRRNTEDDRVVHTPWQSGHIDGVLDNYAHHLGICAAGAHYLAATPDRADDKLNRRILAHTERHFQRMRDAEYVRENENILPGWHNMQATAPLALALETAVLLAGITGKEQYGEMALQTADALIARQQQTLIETVDGDDVVTGYFDRPAPYVPGLTTQPAAPPDALIRLLESDLPGTNRFAYYAALKIYADLFVKKTYRQDAPYPLIPRITPARSAHARLLGQALTVNREAFYCDAPVYDVYAIGIESYNLSRLAAFLNDAELQSIAINLLQWQLGRNPSSYSLIAEVGRDSKPDMMSTTLGHMPGMMIIGIGSKDGEPFFPQHHGRNEIYTQEAPYLQALVQASAACVLDGRITRGGAAARRVRLSLRNAAFGREFSVKTNRHGEFDHLMLPGGVTFDVACDGVPLGRFTSISGMRKTLALDLEGGLTILRATAPARVAAGRDFQAVVEVFAWGAPPPPCEIEAHGYQAAPVAASRVVRLEPGINQVAFDFLAPGGNRPYVVMFNRKAEPRNLVAAAGAVREAE